MRINEVEQLVGITKKNIRFYEKEGLLRPDRSLENGYRDYSSEDTETLKRIKLLRKLSVPLEEIRKIQSGIMTMEGILKRHVISLEEQSSNLSKVQAVCMRLIEKKEQYAELDTDGWLAEIQKMEKEGMRFMDVRTLDKRRRKKGSLIAAVFFCVLMCLIDGVILWAFWMDPADAPPIGFMLLLMAIPAVFVIAVIAALRQRMKEIDGGEEDAAAQY